MNGSKVKHDKFPKKAGRSLQDIYTSIYKLSVVILPLINVLLLGSLNTFRCDSVFCWKAIVAIYFIVAIILLINKDMRKIFIFSSINFSIFSFLCFILSATYFYQNGAGITHPYWFLFVSGYVLLMARQLFGMQFKKYYNYLRETQKQLINGVIWIGMSSPSEKNKFDASWYCGTLQQRLLQKTVDIIALILCIFFFYVFYVHLAMTSWNSGGEELAIAISGMILTYITFTGSIRLCMLSYFIFKSTFKVHKRFIFGI